MSKVCIVPGCASKSAEKGTENVNIFKAPSIDFKKWKSAIPNMKKKVRKGEIFVCALHFAKSELHTYGTIRLPDNTVIHNKKDRLCLMKGAVPSIFPDCFKNINVLKTRRIRSKTKIVPIQLNTKIVPIQSKTKIVPIQSKTKIVPIQPKTKIVHIQPKTKIVPIQPKAKIVPIQPKTKILSVQPKTKIVPTLSKTRIVPIQKKTIKETEKIVRKPEADVKQVLQNLIKNLSNVVLPSKYWTIDHVGHYIVCARWSPKDPYSVSRRVVILKNLEIQIHIGEKKIGKDFTVQTIEDLSSVLEEIDGYEVYEIRNDMDGGLLATMSEFFSPETVLSSKSAPAKSSSDKTGPFTYEKLSSNLSDVTVPNKLWTLNCLPDYIICAKWSFEFDFNIGLSPIHTMRRVIILKNLQVSVYVENKKVNIYSTVTSITGLSELLKQIERLRACPGAINKVVKNCRIIPEIGQKRCSECSNANTQKKQKMKKAALNTLANTKRKTRSTVKSTKKRKTG